MTFVAIGSLRVKNSSVLAPCFKLQLYSLIGFMFPEDSSPAFALFKFVQVNMF